MNARRLAALVAELIATAAAAAVMFWTLLTLAAVLHG
jgi:hypothetical protein